MKVLYVKKKINIYCINRNIVYVFYKNNIEILLFWLIIKLVIMGRIFFRIIWWKLVIIWGCWDMFFRIDMVVVIKFEGEMDFTVEDKYSY